MENDKFNRSALIVTNSDCDVKPFLPAFPVSKKAVEIVISLNCPPTGLRSRNGKYLGYQKKRLIARAFSFLVFLFWSI